MKKLGFACGLTAALVLLGGCVSFSKTGPGGRAMMGHHYTGEAGKVVGAMANAPAPAIEAPPPAEPAPETEPAPESETPAPPEA